jgi:hypothetical protein
MNAESSRSHFCCIITVHKSTGEGLLSVNSDDKENASVSDCSPHETTTTTTTTKIHLIDLAGSEMVIIINEIAPFLK